MGRFAIGPVATFRSCDRGQGSLALENHTGVSTKPVGLSAFSTLAILHHKIPSTPTSSKLLVLPVASSTHVMQGRTTRQTLDEVRTSGYAGSTMAAWRPTV